MIKKMKVKAEKMGGHYHCKMWVNGALICGDVVLREDEFWHFLEVLYMGGLATKGYSFYPRFEVEGMSESEVHRMVSSVGVGEQ